MNDYISSPKQKSLEDIIRKISKELENTPIGKLPNFLASTRYQTINEQLVDFIKEESHVIEEIADLQEDIKETNEEQRRVKKKRLLDRAKIKYLKIIEQKESVEKELQGFISDVLQLAETLIKYKSTDSPRLEEARKRFLEGDFEGADEVLNEKDIYDEIDRHKAKIKDLAKELIIKARTTELNKKEDWFAKAKQYYKDAAIKCEDYDSCFNYANFLDKHLQPHKAITYYEKAMGYTETNLQKHDILKNLGILCKNLKEYEKSIFFFKSALDFRKACTDLSPETYQSDIAGTLHNIGISLFDNKDFIKSKDYYNNAIKTYRDLAAKEPEKYDHFMANSLNALGVLQLNIKEIDQANNSFSEAEHILRRLVEVNFQTNALELSDSLQGLAKLEKDIEETDKYFSEALQIRKKLADINPYIHLPDVAQTLINLFPVKVERNEINVAEEYLWQALKIYRDLAELNPEIYAEKFAGTSMDLGVFYIAKKPNEQQSLFHVKSALGFYRSLLAKDIPYVDKHIRQCENILRYWSEKNKSSGLGVTLDLD